MPHITHDNAKSIINLLTAHQPLTFNDFKEALKLRSFDLKKLLQSLVDKKVIIKESGSGEEKYWLNEEAALNFLGREPAQKKRVKHPKKRKKREEPAPGDSIYG
jgi:transcription initiation factor IIE alpha subunit